MKARVVLPAALIVAWALGMQAGPARAADDASCVKCHAAVASGRSVHAAVEMGCDICHAQLDASAVPHRSTAKFPKGLSAEPAALCLKCHEAALFEGGSGHAPVVSGPCMACHNPHASPNVGLLKKKPASLCLDCHSEVANSRHMVAGITRRGHPLGNENKEVQDPLRPGKPFYCAACHEPHKSGLPRLLRIDSKLGMGVCQKCHQK